MRFFGILIARIRSFRIVRLAHASIRFVFRKLRKNSPLLVLLLIIAIIVAPPWGLQHAERGLNVSEPIVDAAVSQREIFFADPVTVSVRVLLDTRTTNPASVRILWNPQPFVVLEEKTRSEQSVGTIAMIVKTYTIQCVSCLPQNSAYMLTRPAAVFFGEDGTLRTATPKYIPAVRIHSRLEDYEVREPFAFLRPIRPTVPPLEIADGLVPPMLALGTAILVATGLFGFLRFTHWRKMHEARRVALPASPFERFRAALVNLQEDLAQGRESKKILAEALRIFRTLPFHPEFLDEHPPSVRERLERGVFGPDAYAPQEVEAILQELSVMIITMESEFSGGES